MLLVEFCFREFGICPMTRILLMMHCPFGRGGEVVVHHSAYALVRHEADLRIVALANVWPGGCQVCQPLDGLPINRQLGHERAP
jgi:hypothetical protein